MKVARNALPYASEWMKDRGLRLGNAKNYRLPFFLYMLFPVGKASSEVEIKSASETKGQHMFAW